MHYVIGEKALTIVPIADLLGQSIDEVNQKNKVAFSYATLPVCGRSGPYACPRIHQLLFNEIVDIVSESDGRKAPKKEVFVKVPNLFYLNGTKKAPQVMYCSLKSNFISLRSLKKKGIDLTTIPSHIDFRFPEKRVYEQTTVQLLFPFYDPITKVTYSAGTKFVCIPGEQTTHDISVYVLDVKNMVMRETTLPKELCFKNRRYADPAVAIQDFVTIVRSWAHIKNGHIPYVWGGKSFITPVCDDTFTYKETPHASWYVLPYYEYAIKAGFDCSGLIATAAQICGIPYFYKNTTTLSQELNQVKPGEEIHNGDLIWIPGHVMIISDVEKNLLVEARAYIHGYGKVQELPLSKVFKGITTFSSLNTETYKPLKRLDSNGRVVQKVTQIKILSMASVFDKQRE